jgi:hypothetical protein
METRLEPNTHRREVHLSVVDAWLNIHLRLKQGAVMKSNLSIVKSIVAAAALMAGVAGLARADGNSYPNELSVREMQALSSDAPAYRLDAPVFDNAPSAWRQSNPHGLSAREFAALSTFGPAYKPAPVIDNAPSAWRQSRSHGLSVHEMQAASSDAPAWHQPDPSATTALVPRNDAAIVTNASHEPFGARIARFFHATPSDQDTPTN